ncbi:methylated-DNA--[protein]-cysteine S-methyltransferase [Coralliovum pocilloporae]|uniref:methylated-DNA--[protein]-cysteine S-methyltransferase n=1 Tax=Coralliovum pocilloporae TaxID=3066369 RepID=UPI003307613C
MADDLIRYTILDSAIGPLLIGGDADHLTFMHFPESDRLRQPAETWRRDDAGFSEACAQLDAYFAGELTEFDLDYRLDGTEFQKSVWAQLEQIPFGETWSYGDVARRLGNPGASRAVGLANNANPLPVIVPCHRVIGANGALVGFGGGLDLKVWLLRHENIPVPGDPPRDQMQFAF